MRVNFVNWISTEKINLKYYKYNPFLFISYGVKRC